MKDGQLLWQGEWKDSDGSLEEIGPIEFDAYQITRLQKHQDDEDN